ncbi:MAG: DUF2079 domain-containing protein, partial [Bacteroidota bacterium]
MSVFSRNKALTIVLVISGLLFCSISLVNHYNFRTYAWDLGINNNAIYDYAHFRWNDCMLLRPQFQNVLSDHFTIYPILVSPFYWLSGSWTMLLFQIAAILSGGCGVYCYFKLKTDNKWIPVLASIHFFSTWGIFSALAFDYHDNVVAAMFVPWAFYFFEKKEFQKTFLMILLICIGKENMALWSAFICGGLFLLNVKEPEKRNAAALFSIFSIIYFALAVKVFIPS